MHFPSVQYNVALEKRYMKYIDHVACRVFRYSVVRFFIAVHPHPAVSDVSLMFYI